MISGEPASKPAVYRAPLLRSRDGGYSWENLGNAWHSVDMEVSSTYRLYYMQEGKKLGWSNCEGDCFDYGSGGGFYVELDHTGCLFQDYRNAHDFEGDPNGVDLTCDPTPESLNIWHPSYGDFVQVGHFADGANMVINSSGDLLYASADDAGTGHRLYVAAIPRSNTCDEGPPRMIDLDIDYTNVTGLDVGYDYQLPPLPSNWYEEDK